MKGMIVLVLLVFGFIQQSFAQKPTDTELWTGVGMKLKVTDKLGLSLSQQFRFNDTISSLGSANTDLGLKIKATNFLSFKATYRYSVKPTKKNKSRIALDANLSLKKKDFPLSFKYRLRFQETFKQNSTKRYAILRNKVELKYNASKLVDPFIAYEIYFRFNGRNEFRTSRITAGLDWRLLKSLSLTTFYRMQEDIFIKKPQRSHIIGVQLTYSIDARKK